MMMPVDIYEEAMDARRATLRCSKVSVYILYYGKTCIGTNEEWTFVCRNDNLHQWNVDASILLPSLPSDPSIILVSRLLSLLFAMMMPPSDALFRDATPAVPPACSFAGLPYNNNDDDDPSSIVLALLLSAIMAAGPSLRSASRLLLLLLASS